jgi:hypothetical protein
LFNKSLNRMLIAAILISSHAFAQQSGPLKVIVGDPIVNGARLRPYQNQWRMSVVKADGSVIQDAGNWTDELKVVQIDGKFALQRTQLATFKKRTGEVAATTRTVNVFECKTLAPLLRAFERHLSGGGDSSVSIKFGAGSIRLERVEDGKAEISDLPATTAFDFYGGIYALLWASMPLKEGFSVTYPSYAYAEQEHPEKVSWVIATVTGLENVDAGSKGRVKAWVVESDTDIGKLKYWVGQKPPYIIPMDYRQKDGTLWMLKMI